MIRNNIVATIEKVLSIKFPFIRDLGITRNTFYRFSHFSPGKRISQTKKFYSTKEHKNG